MENLVQSIALDLLVGHPDNPNRQSRVNFGKLVRNIERTGRYEPLIVRLAPEKKGYFQIINGHHRSEALTRLGYKSADCIVWDVDDEQADILLATLNRLCGSDELGKKLKLLKRLNKRIESVGLGKLLPQTAKQIERLVELKRPSGKVKTVANSFAGRPMVFFVNNAQQQMIENAISLVEEPKSKMTRAAKRTAAIVRIAGFFINNSTTKFGRFEK